jgi:ATP-dependent DNA ligase
MNTDDESLILNKEYPPIFGIDKLGKTRVWKATVFSYYDLKSEQNVILSSMAVIQHGIYDGKLQTDTRTYTEGKNIGKKNETTPLEQCISEVEKKRKDKIEKEGYSATFPSRDTGIVDGTVQRKIFPMLANKYEPGEKKRGGIVFPCYVQPKLDGLRCVIRLHEGVPTYQSRTGGYFTGLQHLDKPILEILSKKPELILDGELYTQQIPFEELAGIIKKKTLSETDKEKIKCVQYHVYDLIIPKMHFSERLSVLQKVVPDQNAELFENILVTQVPTILADTPRAYKDKFGEYVAQGYEGIMLRNMNGFYQENYRSNDLMKYKEFFEDEYKIVGFKEAMGRDSGTVIWECETKNGIRFSVRPKGTQEARREWFANADKFVGKRLTVIFQELSEMGVPRFPVGKAIRDGY